MIRCPDRLWLCCIQNLCDPLLILDILSVDLPQFPVKLFAVILYYRLLFCDLCLLIPDQILGIILPVLLPGLHLSADRLFYVMILNILHQQFFVIHLLFILLRIGDELLQSMYFLLL